MQLINPTEHEIWERNGRPTRFTKGCATIGAASLIFIIVTASLAVYLPRGSDDSNATRQTDGGNGASPTPVTPTVNPGVTVTPVPATPTPEPARQLLCGGEASKVSGSITGLTGTDSAVVMFGSDAALQTQRVTAAAPNYNFTVSGGDGAYFLSVQAVDYSVRPAMDIKAVNGCLSVPSVSRLSVNEVPSVTLLQTDSDGAARAVVDMTVTPMADANTFKYHWSEDVSRAGYQEGNKALENPPITLDGKSVAPPDLQAAAKLQHDYNIVLDDASPELWTAEHAYRLLQTMRSIPQALRSPYKAQDRPLSVWTLVDEEIANDVQVTASTGTPGARAVRVNVDAFVYASPQRGALGSRRGVFFSKRLHHACVRVITDFGKDRVAMDKIMTERYGCTATIPDALYTTLTKGITNEDSKMFQPFKDHELVLIASMFEEMPRGYHKVKGLKYLLRRRDGLNHPLYPTAPAVAWPKEDKSDSYIEFMEGGFQSDLAHLSRLIIHEKSHFLWAAVLSEDIKNEWIRIGGWTKDETDPDGWVTSKTTEFVSAYAHKKNPNEDLAESLSYFVMNPNKLESRSPNKYNFIRDRIMFGIRYIATIREDLTFTVLNLFPDYTYPGKIKRIDIKVDGAPGEDKMASIELELHTSKGSFSAATSAQVRVTSEIGTFKDCNLRAVSADGKVGGAGHILKGEMKFSYRAKKGLWATDQIQTTDAVGNKRYEGQSDFGWKLYVNNPNEDIIPPKYDENSMKMRVYDGFYVQNGTSVDVQYLEVTWTITEDQEMHSKDPVYTAVTVPSSNKYRMEKYGIYNKATRTGNCTYILTKYHPTGTYQVDQVRMFDMAENIGTENFATPPATLAVTTADPDLTPPELDVNNITVTGEPARPEKPDGETYVTITYWARDDKSGLGRVQYRLLDPQGVSQQKYHYHANFNSIAYIGNPTVWTKYRVKLVLPVGSPPGVWGLQTFEIYDLVGNRKSYSFTETVQFNIESEVKQAPEARLLETSNEDSWRQRDAQTQVAQADQELHTAARREGAEGAHALHDGTLRVRL